MKKTPYTSSSKFLSLELMYWCFNVLPIEVVPTIVVFLQLAYAQEPKSPSVVWRWTLVRLWLVKAQGLGLWDYIMHATTLPQPLFDYPMHNENLLSNVQGKFDSL
jgi:hypothetical protein